METRSTPIATQAMEHLPAGVIVVDAAGIVRYANRFASTFYGLAVDGLGGMPISALLAPIERLREGARNRERRGELSLTDDQGRRRTLGYSISGLTSLEGEELTAVLFQQIDGVQEIRTQRDRLLQLAVVGDVLPSLLHELRNPLAAVTTTLEVLVEEAPDRLQPDLHAVLWELRRLGLGLQGIGGLNQQVHGTTFEAIDSAVEEACKVLASSARAAGVTLRSAVEAMPLLLLDRAAIKGVVFNLVRNAIDACRAGDQVVVSAHATDDEFALSVLDTGRGMTPDELARCTELFYTSKPNGSGIGLAICRQLAERGHGSLSINSEPGVGTTVLVRIPLVPPRD